MIALRRPRRPYSDPYLAGAGLGLVLCAALFVTGRGLGASGAFATTAAGLTSAVAPEHAAASPLFARYLGETGPWRDWLLSRCREEDFTLRGLVAELGERGLQVDYRTVWEFVHAEGLTHKKRR